MGGAEPGPPRPAPRETGPGFTPYGWASTAEDVAARHNLSPAHVLRFDANLPAFPAPLPRRTRDALAARGEYPEGTYRELREAAAAYAGCSPDEVAVDAGADGLIGLVARTYLASGRTAVIEEPTYPLYAIATRIEGAGVRAAPRDLDALAGEAAGANVLWLCNPGNPTGALFAAADIAALAERLPGTIVCVDEAYFEFAEETVAPYARRLDNLVCVRTLSKAFGLAGLRVGYAVASQPVAAELSARRAPGPITNLSATLAADALRSPDAAAREASVAREERERMRRAFAAAGHDVPETHANFVVVETPDALARADDLERRGLVVRAYEGSLRISVRSPADDDLVLDALGIPAPPAARRSATVREPGVRASLVLDGSGRVSSRTGDDDLDARIEEDAAGSGWDLEVVADLGTPGADVERALARAAEEARAAGG